MKLSSSSFIFLIISLIFLIGISSSTVCNYDWNCPNLPYSYCKNRLAINQGLVLDTSSQPHKLLLTGRYNTSYGRPQGHTFLVQIDTSSTGFTQKLEFFNEKPSPIFEIKFVNALSGYLFQTGKPIVTMPRYKQNPTTALYNPSDQTYTDLFTAYANYQGFIADEANNKFYRCGSQGIYEQTPIGYPPTSNKLVFSILPYGDCYAISSEDDDLYFVTNEYSNGNSSSVVQKIPKSCSNCTVSTRLFTTPFIINAFATHKINGRVFAYYSSQDSLYRAPVDNVHEGGIIAQDQWIQSLAVDDLNVYYSTSDKVRKVNQQTTVSSTLYDPSQQEYLKQATCDCVNGFTGDQCQNCNNGTIQWNYGEPFCVPFAADGKVSYCNEAYQCLSGPYAYCYFNSCICKSSFSGPRCDQCINGTVTWDEYGPNCIKN